MSELISDRELLTFRIMKMFDAAGLMNGPCVWGPELFGTGNRKYREFGFSRTRIIDGSVRVYGDRFILVRWQLGRSYGNQKFESVDSLAEWLEARGWANTYGGINDSQDRSY